MCLLRVLIGSGTVYVLCDLLSRVITLVLLLGEFCNAVIQNRFSSKLMSAQAQFPPPPFILSFLPTLFFLLILVKHFSNSD